MKAAKQAHPCEEAQLLSDQLPSKSDQNVGFSLSKPLPQATLSIWIPHYSSFLTPFFFPPIVRNTDFPFFNYIYTFFPIFQPLKLHLIINSFFF